MRPPTPWSPPSSRLRAAGRRLELLLHARRSTRLRAGKGAGVGGEAEASWMEQSESREGAAASFLELGPSPPRRAWRAPPRSSGGRATRSCCRCEIERPLRPGLLSSARPPCSASTPRSACSPGRRPKLLPGCGGDPAGTGVRRGRPRAGRAWIRRRRLHPAPAAPWPEQGTSSMARSRLRPARAGRPPALREGPPPAAGGRERALREGERDRGGKEVGGGVG
ncbi:unnamed protein product [Urochloa humidicola]